MVCQFIPQVECQKKTQGASPAERSAQARNETLTWLGDFLVWRLIIVNIKPFPVIIGNDKTHLQIHNTNENIKIIICLDDTISRSGSRITKSSVEFIIRNSVILKKCNAGNTV